MNQPKQRAIITDKLVVEKTIGNGLSGRDDFFDCHVGGSEKWQEKLRWTFQFGLG